MEAPVEPCFIVLNNSPKASSWMGHLWARALGGDFSPPKQWGLETGLSRCLCSTRPRTNGQSIPGNPVCPSAKTPTSGGATHGVRVPPPYTPSLLSSALAGRKNSLCDTLTSSVTFQTPEVTKQSWKLKCPEEEKEQVSESGKVGGCCLPVSLKLSPLCFDSLPSIPDPGWPSGPLMSTQKGEQASGELLPLGHQLKFS